MTDIKNRHPLKFHSRATKVTEPAVRPGSRPLPREIFDAHADVLAKFDEMENLINSSREHGREASKLSAAADKDDQAYRDKVREALTAGGDVGKIKSKGQELRAQADEHARLASRAQDLAKYKVGAELGAVIQTAAADVFPQLDEQLAAGGEEVLEALGVLGAKLEAWGGIFKAREILSRVHLFGGMVGDYDPSAAMPSEFATAAAAIRELISGPEHLRRDEAEIRAFRADNARADEANANGVALDG